MPHSARSPRFRSRHAEEQEIRLLVLATLPVFLAVALVRRVTGRGGGQSLFGEAKAAAYASIPFAFMG